MSYWPLIVFLIILLAYKTTGGNGTHAGCESEPSCLRCGPKGCTKCPLFIVQQTRHCVKVCPYGHQPRWSTLADYMGRLCIPNGNFLGIPSYTGTVLAGILTATVLCVIFLTSTFVYLKCKRKNLSSSSTDTNSDVDDSPERRDFLKQLETLRPYAQTYLDMLNDTRRQLRELHKNGDLSALSAYRPVVRDLAKILLLLNRKSETIFVPDDWEQLFNWAEKALRRYRRMSDVVQAPQVAQLIDFLQGPVVSSQDESRSVTMSTFKPEQVFGSSPSLQNVAIKNFSTNYEAAVLNPQWKFEYSLVDNKSEFNPNVWKNSKEYLNSCLFLDDDFCQLGFRPQDEITTEL